MLGEVVTERFAMALAGGCMGFRGGGGVVMPICSCVADGVDGVDGKAGDSGGVGSTASCGKSCSILISTGLCATTSVSSASWRGEPYCVGRAGTGGTLGLP
jgi:hypothetical protein